MIKKSKKNLTFFDTVKKAGKTNQDYIIIAFDLIYCKLRFHITYDEYLKYKFYNFKNRYRKNFILIYHKNSKYRNLITRKNTFSKYGFYNRIPDLYSREIICVPQCGQERFLEFIKKHNKIIIKPDIGSLGRGIQALVYKNDEHSKEIFDKLSSNGPIVCEEFIRQHELLQFLNPFCVNTIRVVSIFTEGKVEIISAVLKTSSNINSIVDNMNSGGIGAQIDIETGIVTTFGIDYEFNSYSHHPISEIQFIGMNIPNWDKVIELVKKAHNRLSNWLIFGWDIAITQTGVELVEANSAPGPLLMQTMDCIPKGKKLLPLLKKDITKKDFWSSN